MSKNWEVYDVKRLIVEYKKEQLGLHKVCYSAPSEPRSSSHFWHHTRCLCCSLRRRRRRITVTAAAVANN